jgi:hypothetical protein
VLTLWPSTLLTVICRASKPGIAVCTAGPNLIKSGLAILKCFCRYVFIAASRAGSAATVATFAGADAALCANALVAPNTADIETNENVSEARAPAHAILMDGFKFNLVFNNGFLILIQVRIRDIM